MKSTFYNSRKEKSDKNIIIVSIYADTYSNPTLLSLFEIADKEDVNIFLISPKPIYRDKKFTKIKHLTIPVNYFNSDLFLKRFISRIIFCFFSILIKLFIVKKVKAIIGIDSFGFINASKLRRLYLSSSLIYLSFEIFFKEEINNNFIRKIKENEESSFLKVDVLVIQDEIREELFLKQLSVVPQNLKVYKIPVSSLPYNNLIKDDKFLLNKHSVNKLRIIYSGTIAKWGGIEDLLYYLDNSWNTNFQLEIHSRYSNPNIYFERIEEMQRSGKSVSLHKTPFNSFEEYLIYLTKFDVGLVFYVTNNNDMYTGKNLENIGLSSGKFSTYLMLGMPVITSWNETYEKLNNIYHFGILINDFSEIPSALTKISENYIYYRQGALLCYKNVLNPELQIEQFLKEIIICNA